MTKYFLAIDYGEKKCGLAIADEETKIATAYKIIETQELLREIERINQKSPIEKIIIGIFEAGKVFENKKRIGRISEQIKNKTELKIEFQDEIFSTKLAQENLKQLNNSTKIGQDDAEAARIILQSWLDKKN